ncbi:MAG: hypothetical protein RLY16_2442 [Bacteroidota bacterium]|jgi:tetratricopeptide (TPR) repeat protein
MCGIQVGRSPTWNNFCTLLIRIMKLTPILALGCIVPMWSMAQADSADLYFQKGIEEKNLRHYLVASRQFDKAVQFNPSFVEAYLENGYVNLEMRRTDQALMHFTKVNQLSPTNPVALQQLMQISYDYRQFAKARDYALKCTNCKGADKIIAMSYYHSEDYGNAIKGFSKYLASNPTDADAVYTLARCYLDMEEYKSAVPHFVKAVALDEQKSMWAYELGMLYFTLNDYGNAAQNFAKAAARGYNTNSSDYIENMGYALIYTGEFEKGEQMLASLIQKRPNDKTLIRDVADVFYQKKLYDKSLGYCQQLMEMDMQDGKALYLAGLCFQKKGEKEKGQGMCDKAIELDPSLGRLRSKSMDLGL